MEIKDLISKLNEEVGEPSKNLSREDALAMVSTFVKDIKKKFPSKADRGEILRTALKTFQFYVDEIEHDSGDFDADDGDGFEVAADADEDDSKEDEFDDDNDFDDRDFDTKDYDDDDGNDEHKDGDTEDLEFFDRILRRSDEED
jgi:hypothetical protein